MVCILGNACVLSAVLSMIMALNEQDGFQISSYVSPSRVFNFSLLRTCSPTNLCQALSISCPASLLLSFPFVLLSYWHATMMYKPSLQAGLEEEWRPLKPVQLRTLHSEAIKLLRLQIYTAEKPQKTGRMFTHKLSLPAGGWTEGRTGHPYHVDSGLTLTSCPIKKGATTSQGV